MVASSKDINMKNCYIFIRGFNFQSALKKSLNQIPAGAMQQFLRGYK